MKKVMSIFLSVLMIVGLFCGCSAEDEQSVTLKYTIDSHYSDFSDNVLREYENLCKAVENRDGEIRLSISVFDSVDWLFHTSFPLYSLVESIEMTPDEAVYMITYVNNEETHKALINDFKQKITDIMSECGYGEVNINQYIFNVYSYVSKNFTVDESITTPFDAVINSKGGMAAINSAFEYLVLQGGGTASHLINYNGAAKFISQVKFNGNTYYFDPASESSGNNGMALRFFAMNNSDLKKLYATDSFTYTNSEKIEPVDDKTYDSLRASKSYEADSSQVKVTLKGENKEFLLTFE